MEALIIESNRNTPEIVLNPAEDKFSVSGRSFPENSKRFYEPVLAWFDAFCNSEFKPNNIRFQFELFYVSSSSIISVLEIIKRLSQLHESGSEVAIVWSYDEDDEDIRKIGEDYERLTSISFEFKANSSSLS